jgi:polyhydroxyalkanoate synthase subunit PhaC
MKESKSTLFNPEPEKWAKWNKVLAGGMSVPIGTSPRDPIYQRDILTVYKYRRETPALHETPILLIYSLINRPSVLDLQPTRSVVESLLNAGYEVYLLDWGTPDPLDQMLSLEDYINTFIRTAVRKVCIDAGLEQIHLLGYCMGGTMSAMYTALYPERVKNLLLLGTPLNFRSKNLLYRWSCNQELFDVNKIVDAWSMAPPWSFDGYSLLTIESKPQKLMNLYDNIDDPEFLESFLATEQWVNDNIPLAGATFAEFCTKCFVENQLSEGRMEIGGKPIKLESITCPVLIIAGEADHLVPPETVGHDPKLFPNSESIFFKAGHIGLSISRNAHKKLWPQVAEWLAKR